MNQQGFTLIEGMLAAVFLGVGLLLCLVCRPVSLGRNVDASELTRVTNLATEMMEANSIQPRICVSIQCY